MHNVFRLKPWLRCVGVLLALGTAPLLTAAADTADRPAVGLPALGEHSDLDLAQERQMGDRIMRQVYRDPNYVDDPALLDYLDAIWTPLREAARQRGELSPELERSLAWELMLVRDRSVNAFALPGGYLGVHTGLLAVVERPDELASVLAHELSHVTQRHIARLMTEQNRLAPWLMGAMIVGAVAASRSTHADVGQAMIVGGQAVAAQSQLNFSRDMEREADRIGLLVLTEAGFSGQGFVGMFDQLAQASRLNDDGAFPYLRSHPLTTERIADMRTRLEAADTGRGPAAATAPAPLSADPAWHALMMARARVLSEPDVQRLRAWVEATPRTEALARLSDTYARALSALRLRQPEPTGQALAELDALLSQRGAGPARRALLALALEAFEVWPDLSAGPGLRLPTVRAQALLSPQRSLLLGGARTSLAASPEVQRQAVQALRRWTVGHPRDALAWRTLAALHRVRGEGAQEARAEGEAQLAQFDPAGAVDRLRAAHQLARANGQSDWMELSIIDSRLRVAEAQLQELRRQEAEQGSGR